MENAGCPPAEELASLLEGRMSARARDKVLAHLNACESCFQVFTAAAEFRADFPEYAPSLASRSPPRRLILAAAALLLLSLAGTALLLRNAGPGAMAPAVGELVELLPEAPLSSELWPPVEVELRSGNGDREQRIAFELGVLMVGVGVNLEEGKLEEANRRLGLASELRPSLGATAGLDAEAALVRIDRAMTREPDAVHYRLGRWTEAGRLAAARGDDALFSAAAFRDEGEALRAEPLPAEVRNEMEKLREPDAMEMREVEAALTRILLLSSRG